MTKTDLVNFVAEEANLTKAEAARAMAAVEAGVVKGLKENGKVTITGFCTFTAKHKAATTARNPRTNQIVNVAAKTVPSVKAGSKLKEALN